MTFKRMALLLLIGGSVVLLVGLVWLMNANELLAQPLSVPGKCRTNEVVNTDPFGSPMYKGTDCPSRVPPVAVAVIGGATALVGLVSLMFSLSQDKKNS